MALELPKLAKKEKKSSDQPGATLKIAQFFEKNPAMKIVIPVVLFLILVAIFLFVVFGDGTIVEDNESDEIPGTSLQANQVQVIPENNSIIKDKEIAELIDDDPISPDILASAVYTGSVTGSSGLKTALIHIGSEGDVITLAVGETIGDSDWELKEIASDYVIFKAGKLTKKIDIK